VRFVVRGTYQHIFLLQGRAELANWLGEEKIVKERQEQVKGSSLTRDCDAFGANAHEQDRGCLGEGRDGGSW
jgi:hypothetical protein